MVCGTLPDQILTDVTKTRPSSVGLIHYEPDRCARGSVQLKLFKRCVEVGLLSVPLVDLKYNLSMVFASQTIVAHQR